MATAPGTVTLNTGNSPAQTFTVPAGVTTLSVPLTAGGTMQASLARNGGTVVQLAQNNFTFNGSPQTYNYNAFTVMASA